MIGFSLAMRKFVLTALIISLLSSFPLLAQEPGVQETPPPLYEGSETGETLPPDLAVEPLPKPKPKPKPPPEVAQPKLEEKPPEPKIEEAEIPAVEPPSPKIQVEKEIELPPPPKAPEVPVPSNLPVIKPPTEAAPTTDGGPLKDAGGDLQTALAVTFAKYENNFLSPQDAADVFQLYTRAREGVGVILKPKHPSSQLVCDLLGKEGELLSQTQAPAAGQTLSFQTSPFEENALLYLRVKDMNLAPDSPPSELREYSLELRPIAALEPPAPPPAELEPAAKRKRAEPKKSDPPLWQNGYVQYGAAGFALLVLMMVLIALMRRRKKT